jgi:predicted RNA-binding protein (TIGR00451 family)
MPLDSDLPMRTWYLDSDLAQYLSELFSASRVHQLFLTLRTVVCKYFFRLTVPLQSNEFQEARQIVFRDLFAQNWTGQSHSDLSEAVFVHTRGPFDLSSAEFHREVVVDKRAAESVFQGSELFTPGVLSAKGVQKGETVGIVSPQGDLVGVGTATMTGKEMRTRTHGVAVSRPQTVYKTPSLRNAPCYEQGLVYPQSFPAILTSRVLAPNPKGNEVIVDLCAAPGGKTSHIAQLLGDTGKLLAIDNSKNRIRVLKQTLDRLRMHHVIPIHGDATKLVTEFTFKADRILLDPPCSALGVRPKLYEEKSRRDVVNLSKYQMVLIKAASKLLKKHGTLVYSTCTLTPEENENIVNFAVRELGMRVVDPNYQYGAAGLDLDSLEFAPDLVQRFFPDIHGTPGFFIAKLQKNSRE